MAVRNFWVETDIEGRKTVLKGGPRGKNGGMEITLKQRDEGGIVTAFSINCYVEKDQCWTEITSNGKVVASYVTKR